MPSSVWKYSCATVEHILKDWAKLCLIVKLPYRQHRNNYKRQQILCLIGGHSLKAGVLKRCSIVHTVEPRSNGSTLNGIPPKTNTDSWAPQPVLFYFLYWL